MERRKSRSLTERASRVLESARVTKTRHLEILSQFYKETVPQEWDDANRFLGYVRRTFPNTDLVDGHVSVFTVLKLYKMSPEQRQDIFDHLPGYYKSDETRLRLFEEIFTTLRDIAKEGDAKRKSRRKAS